MKTNNENSNNGHDFYKVDFRPLDGNHYVGGFLDRWKFRDDGLHRYMIFDEWDALAAFEAEYRREFLGTGHDRPNMYRVTRIRYMEDWMVDYICAVTDANEDDILSLSFDYCPQYGSAAGLIDGMELGEDGCVIFGGRTYSLYLSAYGKEVDEVEDGDEDGPYFIPSHVEWDIEAEITDEDTGVTYIATNEQKEKIYNLFHSIKNN